MLSREVVTLALPQQFVVGVGIKGLDVAAIDDLLSVHRIAAGEHPDPKVLQQAARQIGAAVRKYRKRHKKSLRFGSADGRGLFC